MKQVNQIQLNVQMKHVVIVFAVFVFFALLRILKFDLFFSLSLCLNEEINLPLITAMALYRMEN